ncbi:MAG: GTPase HflX [Candidatus Marinimicrobia bacterium]|nr:GTPase HflX [Candidatus Neomarinimicrobiota bacterium]
MTKIRSKIKSRQKAILMGVGTSDIAKEELEESLEELRQLAVTAGAEVINVMLQRMTSINPATYIGKGKAKELSDEVKSRECDLVIFDDELSPAQAGSLERILECSVIDRTGLILDIFALHARTKEAKIQVELAQNKYLLPRLTGQWTHLERQEGAIGTRGPGETQLETDRRAVRRRISKLEKELDKIDSQRAVRRANRRGFKLAAAIGYTNAGKTTLLNALSGANALVEDKLFATLDTIVRKVSLRKGNELLLSDTVGFIRKLPHDLVASFKSTLSETIEADLLLHVIDSSQPNITARMEAVTSVLHEIGIEDKPMIHVFNKSDLVDSSGKKESLLKNFPDGVFISAARGDGLEELKDKIYEKISSGSVTKTVSIPVSESRFLSEIHSSGRVLNVSQLDGQMLIEFEATVEAASKIQNKVNKLAE